MKATLHQRGYLIQTATARMWGVEWFDFSVVGVGSCLLCSQALRPSGGSGAWRLEGPRASLSMWSYLIRISYLIWLHVVSSPVSESQTSQTLRLPAALTRLNSTGPACAPFPPHFLPFMQTPFSDCKCLFRVQPFPTRNVGHDSCHKQEAWCSNYWNQTAWESIFIGERNMSREHSWWPSGLVVHTEIIWPRLFR